MATALIISLNFHPGHVSHLRASYHQFEELGFVPCYYVNPAFKDFLPKGSRTLFFGEDKPKAADVAIILFPSQKNLSVIWSLKRQLKTKIIYCFHEPITSFKEFYDSGYSRRLVLIERIKDVIGAFTSNISDAVILPSHKAYANYLAGKFYKNKNAVYLPLLYDDERVIEYNNIERKYFSYIGTVAPDHSFNEFVAFIKWAYKQDRLKGVQFMIATRSVVESDEVLSEMINAGRLILNQGKPMGDETINGCYASTFVIWNAYARTMQSGVLAKSFMFGTPAVVLRKNLSEFTEDGKEVVAIDDNTSFDEIEKAVLRIIENFSSFSSAARKRFEDTFYYRQYNETFEKILSSL